MPAPLNRDGFVSVRGPRSTTFATLSRRRHDFSDADRDLLGRARPFLIQSYRNAIAFEAGRGADGDGAMTAALRATGLTRREAEMVGLVAHGRSSADVAASLKIGVRTVERTSGIRDV